MKLRFNFKNVEEVQDYVNTNPLADRWAMPMIEEWLTSSSVGSEDDEEAFNELNEWLEDELETLEEGYQEFIDSYKSVCYNIFKGKQYELLAL